VAHEDAVDDGADRFLSVGVEVGDGFETAATVNAVIGAAAGV